MKNNLRTLEADCGWTRPNQKEERKRCADWEHKGGIKRRGTGKHRHRQPQEIALQVWVWVGVLEQHGWQVAPKKRKNLADIVNPREFIVKVRLINIIISLNLSKSINKLLYWVENVVGNLGKKTWAVLFPVIIGVRVYVLQHQRPRGCGCVLSGFGLNFTDVVHPLRTVRAQNKVNMKFVVSRRHWTGNRYSLTTVSVQIVAVHCLSQKTGEHLDGVRWSLTGHLQIIHELQGKMQVRHSWGIRQATSITLNELKLRSSSSREYNISFIAIVLWWCFILGYGQGLRWGEWAFLPSWCRTIFGLWKGSLLPVFLQFLCNHSNWLR